MPYPIIVEQQTGAFPSNVVAIDHSYSSSLHNHSIQLLEGRSCRRRAHTSRDQCPCPCQSYEPVVGPLTRADPTRVMEVVQAMLIDRELMASPPSF
jgi:hypothetical protein